MTKDRISLDQIKNRLSSQSDAWQGQNRSHAEAGHGESGASNTVFFSTLIGSVFAAGFAAFIYLGSGAGLPGSSLFSGHVEFVSKSDRRCSGLWRTDQVNNNALTCVLTVDKERFCDLQERGFIATSIARFRDELVAVEANLTANHLSEFGSQVKAVSQLAPSIFEAMRYQRQAEKKRGGMTREDQRRLKRMIASADRYLNNSPLSNGPDPRIASDRFAATIKNAEIAHAVSLRKLIEAGYVSSNDFDWSPDRIVKMAFKGARTPKDNPCINQ
jgi:hypothetical protein